MTAGVYTPGMGTCHFPRCRLQAGGFVCVAVTGKFVGNFCPRHGKWVAENVNKDKRS